MTTSRDLRDQSGGRDSGASHDCGGSSSCGHLCDGRGRRQTRRHARDCCDAGDACSRDRAGGGAGGGLARSRPVSSS